MHIDSTAVWVNAGRASATGGAGGTGGNDTTEPTFDDGGGGGGGGAGHVPGAAGTGPDDGTDGVIGDDTSSGAGPFSGGAGGTTDYAGSRLTIEVGAMNGADGGDAIHLNHAVTIVNANGEIWGGGGGGAGGWSFNGDYGRHGGAGGAPGVAGALGTDIDTVSAEWSSGGAAGYAIRLSGNGAVTWVSGENSPNVEGTVG